MVHIRISWVVPNPLSWARLRRAFMARGSKRTLIVSDKFLANLILTGLPFFHALSKFFSQKLASLSLFLKIDLFGFLFIE